MMSSIFTCFIQIFVEKQDYTEEAFVSERKKIAQPDVSLYSLLKLSM